MQENIPGEVDTPNPFPSFLKEVNFYKKNYPDKNNKGYGNNSFGTGAGSSSDSEGEKYILFNSTLTGSGYGLSSLLSLEIKESLFTPYMCGTLELFDEYNLIETVNFTGNETIEIVFTIQNLSDEIKLKFKVISAKAVNDISTPERINFIEPARIYELEFISDEIFNHTFTDALLKDEKDFIGFISTNIENNNEIKGLINELSKQLSLQPIEIEETKNGIWLKHNEISYPTGKDQGQYPFVNLMQQISTYAVSKENPNAVNFFFWRDRKGWKFKSIEKLIKEGKEKAAFTDMAEIINASFGDVFEQSDLIQTYILETDDEKNPYKVWNAMALNHLDSMKLFGQKAYSSYYKQTKPDFSNPYSNFLDTTEGFTYSIIDYDYHRDYEKVQHIEKNKLISDDIETSPLVIKNTKRLSGSSRKVPEKLTIPSFRYGEDSVYGSYDTLRYNTPYGQWIYNSADMGFGKKVDDPAVVWWDYLGRSGDSRWSNSVWQPQFDMTELDLKTLHTIDKKIREPIREKRRKFAKLKNIKRKWEVYRCAVCCLDSGVYGGTADKEIIEKFQGVSGATFAILFGVTGIFSDLEQEYKLVAAGSFTDIINYDAGDTASQNGLTFSYDLTKEPYNQTIGQFYNIKNEDEISVYKKYVFDRAVKAYDDFITQRETALNLLNNFIDSVDGWISSNDNWITQHLIDCPEGFTFSNDVWAGSGSLNYGFRSNFVGQNIACGNNPNEYSTKYSEWINGGKVPNVTLPEGKCFAPVQFSCPNQSDYEPLPEFIKDCSKNQVVVSRIEVLNNYVASVIDGFYERYYGLYGSSYPYFYPFEVNSYFEQNYDPGELTRCIDNGDCYKTDCFNPIVLEIQKRRAENEIRHIKAVIILAKYLRDTIRDTFIQQWSNKFSEWHNRESFFFSKQPGTSIFTGITGGRTGPINQPLSLYNIKSIKRKEIRGSRYEILARSKGITGAKVGEWLYNIYYGNDPNTSSLIKHPYYDQQYCYINPANDGISDSYLHLDTIPGAVYSYEDSNTTNNPPFLTQYAEKTLDRSEFTERDYVTLPYLVNVGVRTPSFNNFKMESYLNPDVYLLDNNNDQIEEYQNHLNIFQDLTFIDAKPPNLKNESIASYVRIEFDSPIGIDRIGDFPNAFVRDAGSEYFLPYLVQITPGPNGRQTIRNNIAVIGMDPYGFDVAIKKQELPKEKQEILDKSIDLDSKLGSYFSSTLYNSNSFLKTINSTGMDLWPEIGFETERPYYATHPNYLHYLALESGQYYKTTDIRSLLTTPVDKSSSTTRFEGTLIGSSEMDSELGSYYLLSSHQKARNSKSWWSFSFPTKMIFNLRFFGLLNSYYNNGPWYTGQDNGPFVLFNDISNGIAGLTDYIPRLIDSQDVSDLYAECGLDYNYKPAEVFDKIPKFTFNSVEEVHPDIKNYFQQSLTHFLNGDYLIYRPGLLSTDVWKYDLSGESDYGLIKPPTLEPSYDLFDSNFAAQFVVFSRSTNLCKKFTCANPNGKVSTSNCPEDNPYCNCPAQDQIPTEPEPTYLELYKLYNEIRECDLIKENLGEDYLGCIWIDPNNPCSCNCPEIGKKFAEYLEYTRTYATYWDTPANTPLLRNSLISQFMSQQITIGIVPNNNIKVGDLIKLVHKKIVTEEEGSYAQSSNSKDDKDSKRFDGYWMVTEIRHRFSKETIQMMQLVLNRDSIPRKPN